MAEETAPIRQSELHHRLVIDLETTEELGKLAHFLVDIKNHQLEGFLCQRGILGQERIPILWVQVESVGQDSILVRRQGNPISERFDEALDLNRQEIWTDSGNRVGNLVDYCIDLTTGAVTQYLFATSGWQGLTDGIYTFQPDAVVSAGKKRMMVRQVALEAAPQFIPGVQDRVADALHQDLKQTRQDMQSAFSGTQKVAEQVQAQTKQVAEQARSRAGQWLNQVKRRSKKLREQVNDRFADVAANLEDKPPGRSARIPGTTIDVESEPIWGPEDEDSPSSSPDQSPKE